MKYDFTNLSIIAKDAVSIKAAGLFAEEIQLRTGVTPEICETSNAPAIHFSICGTDELPNKDSYLINFDDSGILSISALGLRGLMFGYSYFLRKTTYSGKKITLIKDISGKYIPSKAMRGHQLGYRDTPNTYDAWSTDDYYRYYRDLIFFGCNTCEHIPSGAEPKRNWLMKYNADDLLVEASHLADELDMDVSIWYPNDEHLSLEESMEERKELFKRIPRINAVFVPGGDPGDLYPDEFIKRCVATSKALKAVHPNAEMWPSAQAPHSIPKWGEGLLEELENLTEEDKSFIDGIITGPNHAFVLDELRRRLPERYPIRFYPDITHNHRCEYPVHFNEDDWHFALGSVLGRESVNPRPEEFRLLHRLTRPYVVGSVSYSEGVNDDINKMIWSDLDFFPEVSIQETLEDYSRVFFPGICEKKVVKGILGLERNWVGDPADNPYIEDTLRIWNELLAEKPTLINNWRYVMCLFRARCDLLVQMRRRFELNLIENAEYEMKNGNLQAAINVLNEDFDKNYYANYHEIFELSERLFQLIGMQLDVENYGAKSWERGAVLETLDRPITNRKWLLNKLTGALELPETEQKALMNNILNRNKVDDDEFYFSFAEHGFEPLGVRQEGEFYMDFQGDRPINNGDIPTSMLKVYDHFHVRCTLAGFTAKTDYKLIVNYQSKYYPFIKNHKVIANGVTIYEGPQFGGEPNPDFDKDLVGKGFETRTYILPADIFQNGCLDLEISEPLAGVKLCEFWIVKA